MNPIYRTNLTTVGLLSAILSVSMMMTGCNTTGKKNSTSVKPLSEPSLVYLDDGNTPQRDFDGWMAIAETDYDAKKYARALRAANKALAIDNQAVAARQIAMLSSVKVMESNIKTYHDSASMDSADKATLKATLTNINTLSGRPN